MAKIPGIFERPPRSGTWWVSYIDADGDRHREKAGRRTQAMDLVARRRMEVRDGRFIAPTKGARLTFRDLAAAALAQKKLRLAPLSYITDRRRLEKLLPYIGHVPADRLTPDRIEETLAQLRRSVSTSTTNRYRSLIGSIFSFAVRAGRIAMNPVNRVKRYRENESRLRWMKDSEEAAVRKHLSAEHAAEFDLALHTGMRRGEQYGLKWKDVDLERGILTVRGKTGRRHVVAGKTAIKALRVLQGHTGAEEFVSTGHHGTPQRDWRRWFEDALKKAGVKDFHWHDLRHTFASRLVMRRVDIRTVQELLGHKSIVMTMRYAHLSRDHRAAAVEKMNG